MSWKWQEWSYRTWFAISFVMLMIAIATHFAGAALRPETHCPVCSRPGTETSMSGWVPYDGTLRANVSTVSVYVCPNGNLFALIDGGGEDGE